MHHYRRATTAQWKAWAVKPADFAMGQPDAAPLSAQELLDRGVVVVAESGGLVYLAVACHGDPRPGQFPGIALSDPSTAAGLPGSRETALVGAARLAILRTLVEREVPGPPRLEGGQSQGSTTVRLVVPPNAVLPTDTVISAAAPPVRWAGES